MEAEAGEDGPEGTQRCDRGGDEEYERGENGEACGIRGSGTQALLLSPLSRGKVKGGDLGFFIFLCEFKCHKRSFLESDGSFFTELRGMSTNSVSKM